MLLQFPAFIGPVGTGANKDGRKLNLAYTCQRLNDGQYLNAKSSTWGTTPVLNGMAERGRGLHGDTDPATGMLRGTYVGADPINFAVDTDAIGVFQLVYHDHSRDNFVLGDRIYQNGTKSSGPVVLTLEPMQPVRLHSAIANSGKIPIIPPQNPSSLEK